MITKYICENFGDCELADTFESFELEEHENKCPKCGRDDTLVEDNTSTSEGGSSIFNKLKNPIVAGITGGIILLGGAAYYCFSEGGCFSKDSNVTTISSIEPITLPQEKNETKVIIATPKITKVDMEAELEKEKKEAIAKMNREWESINESNSIKELEAFKTKYPNSKYTSDINSKIKILQKKLDKEEHTKKINDEWNIVKKSNDIELLKEFNRRYPNSLYFGDAKNRISVLKKQEEENKIAKAWNEIKNSSNIDVLEDFKSKYSEYTERVNSRIALLKKEIDEKKKADEKAEKIRIEKEKERKIKNAWESAKSLKELKLFVETYPKSTYVKRAKSKIKKLEVEVEANKKFSLTINTTPSNARVSITNIRPKYYDGIALKKATYNIKISKSGYVTQRFPVVLNENKRLHRTLEEIYVPTPPTRYSLTIDTIPSNAYVSNNSGVVFNNGAKLSRGSYSFTISKNGYHSREISIFLDENMRKVVRLTRKRIAPPPPPPKSECTKMLDRIEKYTNDGREDKKLQELNRFDANRRSCTASEQARGDKF